MLYHRIPVALPDRGFLQPQSRAGHPWGRPGPHTCLQGQPSASSTARLRTWLPPGAGL